MWATATLMSSKSQLGLSVPGSPLMRSWVPCLHCDGAERARYALNRALRSRIDADQSVYGSLQHWHSVKMYDRGS